eukprot:14270828-Alexandrium_andersonii.AAC.1
MMQVLRRFTPGIDATHAHRANRRSASTQETAPMRRSRQQRPTWARMAARARTQARPSRSQPWPACRPNRSSGVSLTTSRRPCCTRSRSGAAQS